MSRPDGSLEPGLRTMTPPGGVLVSAVMFHFFIAAEFMHRAVHRHVPDEHRIVRKLLVEIATGQHGAVRHGGVVVAVGLDHLVLAGSMFFSRNFTSSATILAGSFPGPAGGRRH